MRIFRKLTLALFAGAMACGLGANGQGFHCDNDTAIAMARIRELAQPGGDPAAICGRVAEGFVGVPYEDITRNDTTGRAELRVDAFDELTFVNTVVAMARTATSPGILRARDLESSLMDVSLRRGEPGDFTAKMIYGGDWAIDNKARRNVKELTEDFSDLFKTKSLTWIGRNRDEFAALKDSAMFEKQKMMEFGLRTFKIPHMKRESTEWKQVVPEMRDGDMIMLLSSDPDRDVFEWGFVVKRDDGFHFIHASKEAGKVVEEPETLGRYVKRNSKQTYGWRWLRIL